MILHKRILLLVSSVTYAMKGKEILQSRGFRAYIERIPRDLQNVGCGYCIYVNRNTDMAEKILLDSGVRVLGRLEQEVEE